MWMLACIMWCLWFYVFAVNCMSINVLSCDCHGWSHPTFCFAVGSRQAWHGKWQMNACSMDIIFLKYGHPHFSRRRTSLDVSQSVIFPKPCMLMARNVSTMFMKTIFIHGNTMQDWQHSIFRSMWTMSADVECLMFIVDWMLPVTSFWVPKYASILVLYA